MKLAWSGPATADLKRIEAWLTAEVDSGTAQDQLQRIRLTARSLLVFPRRKPELTSGRRYAQVRDAPYVLIYSVQQSIIYVLRVRHNKEDWQRR